MRFSRGLSAVFAPTFLLTLAGLASAAPGGISIQILVESGRSILAPSSAEALDACLAPDGTADLVYDGETLTCPEPTGSAFFGVRELGGIVIIDDLHSRQVDDGATGLDLMDVVIADAAWTGPLDLEWQVDPSPRCASATGLCGNYDGDDADRLAEAVGQCADLDGDGAADLFNLGGELRCASALADGQPLVEVARIRIAAPAGTSAAEIEAALTPEQTATYLEIGERQGGIEILVVPGGNPRAGTP